MVRNLHDALPGRPQDYVGKDLNDEGRWFAASSPVLPLTEPGDVSQQDTQSDPMELW